jgi:hypothetical protein
MSEKVDIMKNRNFIAVELILLLTALVFAILWIVNPKKNYEPFTVIPILLTGFLEVKRRFFNKGKGSNTEAQIANNVSTDDGEEIITKRISEITVSEIINSINTSAPLMKEEMEKKYNGIRVKWTGYLKNARMNGQNKVEVNMHVDKNSIIGNSIWFSEKIEKIPEIRTLAKESKICVLGDIISASGAGISVTLKPIDIEIIREDQ